MEVYPGKILNLSRVYKKNGDVRPTSCGRITMLWSNKYIYGNTDSVR